MTRTQKELRERDTMKCRFCRNEERASEGYPCVDCTTFICLRCTLRGVIRCLECEMRAQERAAASEPAKLAWPEH